MKTSYLDISGKIDPFYSSAFEMIQQISEVPFLVIGAFARDLVLNNGYGIPIARRTTDIDIAIQVNSWIEFERIKKELVETKHFKVTRQYQRLLYKDVLPIDIVPFGKIEEDDHIISWPPDHSVQMTVLGLDVQSHHECINSVHRHE